MASTFGETPPRRKRRRAPDDPIHKNVLVLRNGQDVTKRSDGVVLMPNTIEQAKIKKKEYGQFKKITLNVSMTERDVKMLLEKTFPFLTGQRFYCASVVDNRTRLDFHGEPCIWSGALINKNIKGNSALYIFSKENHSLEPVRLMEKLHISNASDTSDSGFETPAALCNNTREVLLPSSTSNKMPDPPPNVQVEYPMDEELNRTYNEYSSTDDLVIQEEFCASSYSKGSVPTPIWAEAIRSYKPGVQRVNLMLIGQESAGKTSLGKDLKESTVSIDDQDNCESVVTTGLNNRKHHELVNNGGSHQASTVNCEVVQEETHQGAAAENLVQEIFPSSYSVKGGKKFVITLLHELSDNIKSGKARFGCNEVKVTRLNSFTFTGYIPSAQQPGQVDVFVFGEANEYVGYTHFEYVDEMQKVISQAVKDPAEMSKLFRLLWQQHDVKRVHSNAQQNTAAPQPGQVDVLFCTEANEDEIERIISQFAEDPAEMSKLFRLLSQQYDVKRMESCAAATGDEQSIENGQLSCSDEESDDNQSGYLADVENSSCSSFELDSDWSDSEDMPEPNNSSCCSLEIGSDWSDYDDMPEPNNSSCCSLEIGSDWSDSGDRVEPMNSSCSSLTIDSDWTDSEHRAKSIKESISKNFPASYSPQELKTEVFNCKNKLQEQERSTEILNRDVAKPIETTHLIPSKWPTCSLPTPEKILKNESPMKDRKGNNNHKITCQFPIEWPLRRISSSLRGNLKDENRTGLVTDDTSIPSRTSKAKYFVEYGTLVLEIQSVIERWRGYAEGKILTEICPCKFSTNPNNRSGGEQSKKPEITFRRLGRERHDVLHGESSWSGFGGGSLFPDSRPKGSSVLKGRFGYQSSHFDHPGHGLHETTEKMTSTFGGTSPRRKRSFAHADPIHKNVLVLRNGQDVTKRSDGVVLMPNTIEQAKIKRQEYGQFKKITLNVSMTESDVKTLLEQTFTFLTGQRFYRASVVDCSTRLDFHGEPCIWSGALINKNIKGNSALYIFSEENHFLEPVRLMGNLHISNGLSTNGRPCARTTPRFFNTVDVSDSDSKTPAGISPAGEKHDVTEREFYAGASGGIYPFLDLQSTSEVGIEAANKTDMSTLPQPAVRLSTGNQFVAGLRDEGKPEVSLGDPSVINPQESTVLDREEEVKEKEELDFASGRPSPTENSYTSQRFSSSNKNEQDLKGALYVVGLPSENDIKDELPDRVEVPAGQLRHQNGDQKAPANNNSEEPPVEVPADQLRHQNKDQRTPADSTLPQDKARDHSPQGQEIERRRSFPSDQPKNKEHLQVKRSTSDLSQLQSLPPAGRQRKFQQDGPLLDRLELMEASLSRCLDQEYKFGRSKCWINIAENLKILEEDYQNFNCYQVHSPTEVMFEFLQADRPEITVGVLKDALAQIERHEKCGRSKCWKNIAENFKIPEEDYQNFNCNQVHSPTEVMFELLQADRPEITVGVLKDVLAQIERHEKSNKSSLNDETLVCSLFDSDPDIIREMAFLSDKQKLGLKDWSHLAAKLDVARTAFMSFETCSTVNLTKELFNILEVRHPKLTVGELIGHLKGIKRQDVISAIKKSTKATPFEQCQDTSVLGRRSSSPEFNHDGKKGVIISLARVHHQRHTSLVYCCGSKEEESARVLGDPFRHHNRDGRYVWTNEELRDNNIEDGSIILYKSQCFLRNSEKKLNVEKIQMDLDFGESAFEGIKDAFPLAEIAETKGIYMESLPPEPRMCLISMKYAVMENERIIFGTRNGEEVNLKLNCRENLHLSTSPVVLQLRGLTDDDDDVGNVASVKFSTSECGIINPTYQAVCEGLVLKHKAKVISIDDEPVKIKNQSGKMILVPGSVKFDTGDDAGTGISNELVEELNLKPDCRKRRRVTGPGGTVLTCSVVEVTVVIRRRKFRRTALVGATAPGTDLLIGMDIIKRLNDKNYTLGE